METGELTLIYILVFRSMVSLHRPLAVLKPETCYVDQTGLQLGDMSVFTSQVSHHS